jgi:hypothetical protein
LQTLKKNYFFALFLGFFVAGLWGFVGITLGWPSLLIGPGGMALGTLAALKFMGKL